MREGGGSRNHNTHSCSAHTRQDMAEVAEADYSFPKCKGREGGGTYSTKRIHGEGEKKKNPSWVLTFIQAFGR